MIKPAYRVAILLGIMKSIRPFLGPVDMCIYPAYPCTDHAVDQLMYQPFWRASISIIVRFLKCNPLTSLWRWLRGTTF